VFVLSSFYTVVWALCRFPIWKNAGSHIWGLGSVKGCGSFFQAIFENIDPESLTNQVMKYHKVVLQLEKGLPPNAVVPQLRGKVDKMRHKVRFHY
jgi:hypothetical protein